jgi:hypothetical protein
MASSGPDWIQLAERNERLVAPADARPVATAPAGAGAQDRPGATARTPWRLRGRRTAAAAAASLALAGTALASAGIAAGSAQASQHAVPAAASWKIVKTVHGSGAPSFTAITASSASSAWAFEAPLAGTAKPAAWRLSGSSWTQVSFPGRSGQPVVAAGSSSAGDVWAITSNGSHSRALWWNGSSWAAAGVISASIDDVVVLGSRNVWAFGEPFFPGHAGTWHYNGHRWKHLASGHGLSGGSALSAHSIWAFGSTSVARWNGHGWSRTSVASLLPANTLLSHSSLTGIYAQSSKSVWAVGTGGRQDEGGPAVVLHFNGTRWSRVALDSGSSTPGLAQVVPDGSGGLWIPVPSTNGIPFKMLRYSGGHLKSVAMPVSGTKLNVTAVAAIPHAARALGVGATHKKNQLGKGQSAVILEYGS